MASYTKYIALDFGTSGCAISLGFVKPDPNNTLVYSAWSKLKTGSSVKCPSILLVNPLKKFEKFGEEASEAYNKLSKDDAKRYYFFYRFKMELYRTPDATTIVAANGQELPAIDVFAMTLQFLKDTALQWCKSYDNIKWIVTVPAIWSDAAKEMMRKASDKVGLVKESMMLVYEPEAAALFCQYDFLKQQHLSTFEKSYLVVDCGGGTVDIVAHKMTKEERKDVIINELASPAGGKCGGFAINDQFEVLLQKIFKLSKDAFIKLKNNCPVHWNKIINNDFEASKLLIDPQKHVPLTIDIPKPIRKEISKISGKTIEDLVKAYNNRDIEWDSDDLAIVLNYPAVLQLFNPVIDEIYSLINNVLTRKCCQCITAVLMVGGFANSKVLFEDIKARLKKHYPHIETYCSSDPTFSVVKGAVLNAQLKSIMDAHLQNAESATSLTAQLETLTMQTPGTDPASPSVSTGDITKYLPFVVSRIMKYTIGIETTVLFDETIHDRSKRYFYGGQYFCKEVFEPLVKANESVHIGSSKKRFKFRPLTEEQSYCDITIFATEKENVKYVDDADCYVRAQVVIRGLPRYNTDLSREVELCVDFYETECEISAYSVTAKEIKKVTVDYHFLPNKYLPPPT